MKLYKYDKFLESNEDIHSICKKYGIEDYTVNEDGSIDVEGSVYLSNRNLTKLPLKFNHVSGGFYCTHNELTTLEGSPKSVGGGFFCSDNKLTTLEGSPQLVSGNFSCGFNQLTTLEGSPKSVGGGFYCYNNKLETLEGSPQSVGGFDFYNNQLTDFIGFPEFWEGYVDFGYNTVYKILKLFPEDKRCKAIYWINEYEVIQGKNIILPRLEEVFEQLKLEVPDIINIEGYEI